MPQIWALLGFSTGFSGSPRSEVRVWVQLPKGHGQDHGPRHVAARAAQGESGFELRGKKLRARSPESLSRELSRSSTCPRGIDLVAFWLFCSKSRWRFLVYLVV